MNHRVPASPAEHSVLVRPLGRNSKPRDLSLMDCRPLNDFIVHLLAHLLAEEELLIHAQPSVMLRLEALPIGSLTISYFHRK
jgi:hypothetical protein